MRIVLADSAACGVLDSVDWDLMLADLESRFDADRRADLVAEAAELAEAERGTVLLTDRLRAAEGREVTVRTRGGSSVAGQLARVSPELLLIQEGEGIQALVPVTAVVVAGPLPGPAPSLGPRAGLTMRAALRALARRGVSVRLLLQGAEVSGRLLRVGADHVDVAAEGTSGVDAGTSRTGNGRGGRPGVMSVALASLDVLRSR